MSERNVVWGMHSERGGGAEYVFLERDLVAIGWSAVGDLRKLPKDREAIKQRVADAYPDHKPGAIPVYAGVLFRFLHEMKEGDYVVYPARLQPEVYIGRVDGPYQYAPDINPHYPNVRKVQWLTHLPRTRFRQGALYEIGSAVTLFLVRRYAEDFLKAASSPASAEAEVEDVTVAWVAEEIERQTEDFVVKRLGAELKGHPFTDFVANLLEAMGYRTRVSPSGADGGIDIIAHRDELGFEPPLIKVQVKSHEDTISNEPVQALLGTLAAGEFGLFVTLGTFRASAQTVGKNRSNLRLIGRSELFRLITQHYDALDVKYKSIIPLKRVYIPEQVEEE